MKRFSAPWGKLLIWTSVLSAVLLVGIAVASALIDFAPTPSHLPVAITCLKWSYAAIPILIVAVPLGAALFIIHGYTITPNAILVHRLFWNTRLPREGLVSATVEPKVMNRSLRLCGNGGLFSFSGWFWSKSLGRYRAYVTDLNRTVVLRWSNKRTAVVSPDDPEAFVRELMG